MIRTPMRLALLLLLLLLGATAALAQPPQAELPAASPMAGPVVTIPAYSEPPASAAPAVQAAPAIAAQTVEIPAAPAAPAPVAMSTNPNSGSASAPLTGFGLATRNWVDLQVSGAASVNDSRPMPGEIATRVYDRYLKSYTYPIPQQFPRQSFGSSSNSGSTSGSGSSGAAAGTGSGGASASGGY